MGAWPIAFEDVLAARERLRPHLPPTPLRSYPSLDLAVGRGIRVLVKHENHNPTNAFKVRNGLSVLTANETTTVGQGIHSFFQNEFRRLSKNRKSEKQEA